jgi:pimeloyl-ACP methyl ester carboxylesterase
MPYLPRRIAEQQKVGLRGLTFNVHHWRGTNPAPIVLLHGFADCGASFQLLVDAMPDACTLLAIDQRGFGDSQWPQDGYWFPDYFADLDAWLEVLSPHAPVTLVGHSMGGHIAMLYAGIRPERVHRCINLEGFGFKPTVAHDAPSRYRQWLDEVRAGESFATNKRYPSSTVLAESLVRRHQHVKPEYAEFVAQLWMKKSSDAFTLRYDPRHKRVNPVLYRDEEVRACWQQITAPVLLVAAEQSEFYEQIRDHLEPASITQHFKDAQAALLTDAGHMMHWEQPEQVARLIIDFMNTPT